MLSRMDGCKFLWTRAFDTVPHHRLLGKLEYYGVRDNLLRWSESFLVGRSQSVLVDGVKSAEESVLSGVPQGPVVFLLYGNDPPLFFCFFSSI